jgi:hypothetical protein
MGISTKKHFFKKKEKGYHIYYNIVLLTIMYQLIRLFFQLLIFGIKVAGFMFFHYVRAIQLQGHKQNNLSVINIFALFG